MMKGVTRRLHQLERRLAPQQEVGSSQSLSVALVIRERRRRRCEASGEPFEELPLQPISLPPGTRLTVAETLQRRRLAAYEQNLHAASAVPIATDISS